MFATLDIHSYQQYLKEKEILISYQGPVSQTILLDLGLNLKDTTYSKTTSQSARRVFAVFIELAQNILLHSEERTIFHDKQKEVGHGLLVVRRSEQYFQVISNNLAKITAAERIKNRIDHLNSLNTEELKQFYKEQRTKPHEEGKKGGNIGLVDMARKSGLPMTVNYKEVSNTHCYMTLEINLYREANIVATNLSENPASTDAQGATQ